MPLLQFLHLSLGRDSATVKRAKCINNVRPFLYSFASFAPSWLKNPVYREGAKNAKKRMRRSGRHASGDDPR